MYEVEVEHVPLAAGTLPPDIRRRFLEPRSVTHLGHLAWEDHCTECAWPQCARIEGVVDAPPACCSWDELRDLARAGVGIGAHSVTHVPLSRTSTVRGRFEIAESKRLCEVMLGPCEAFAYPFGMAGSHSEANRAELERAGYTTAFLTGSEFITSGSDRLTLPRIAMPDESMSLPEFRARASGAGIALQRVKTSLRREARRVGGDRDDAHPAGTGPEGTRASADLDGEGAASGSPPSSSRPTTQASRATA